MTGTANTNFRLVKITENCGFEGQESVAVYQDVIYWLWKDGVYEMGPGGVVKCISDGKVRNWFTSDTYFNRAKFSIAAAQIIPDRKVYRLFLCAAGSSTLDRFVDYDISNGSWWGPHTVSGLSPACTLTRPDADDVLIPTVGMSSGRLFHEQATRTDDTATAIDFDVTTKRHSGDTPDIDKLWGQLSILGVAQASGTLTITPSVGDVDIIAGPPFTWDMTKAREQLRRLGTGKHARLNFRQNTVGVNAVLSGYECEWHELGQR